MRGLICYLYALSLPLCEGYSLCVCSQRDPPSFKSLVQVNILVQLVQSSIYITRILRHNVCFLRAKVFPNKMVQFYFHCCVIMSHSK